MIVLRANEPVRNALSSHKTSFRQSRTPGPPRGQATGWQLTKRAALDGESEKAELNLRWRGIPGECTQWTSHLGRGDSPI